MYVYVYVLYYLYIYIFYYFISYVFYFINWLFEVNIELLENDSLIWFKFASLFILLFSFVV